MHCELKLSNVLFKEQTMRKNGTLENYMFYIIGTSSGFIQWNYFKILLINEYSKLSSMKSTVFVKFMFEKFIILPNSNTSLNSTLCNIQCTYGEL